MNRGNNFFFNNFQIFLGTLKQVRPPYFLSWITNCLENNSSETLANLVEKVTYNNEDFISDIIFVDPLGSAPVLGKCIPNPFLLGALRKWKSA